MTAMSNVLPSEALPSLAVVQFCGTVTVPHWAVRLRGSFGFSFSASAPHAFHRMLPPPAASVLVPDGARQLAIVEQPVAVTMKAARTASVTLRRILIST